MSIDGVTSFARKRFRMIRKDLASNPLPMFVILAKACALFHHFKFLHSDRGLRDVR
jgi:hypothetical protein